MNNIKKINKDTWLYILFTAIIFISFLLPWTQSIDEIPGTSLNGFQYIMIYPMNEIFPIALSIIAMPIFALAIMGERLRNSPAKLERIFMLLNILVFISDMLYHVNSFYNGGLTTLDSLKYFFGQVNIGIYINTISVVFIYLLGEKRRGNEHLIDEKRIKKNLKKAMVKTTLFKEKEHK